MDNNKNPSVPADGKDDPETLAGYRDADCGKCVFVSSCPDAHGMPGPCNSFIDGSEV